MTDPFKTKPCKVPVLSELLIPNVNTWGNVQYNIPIRLSDNETRTATSIAHRQIPPIPHNFDCKIYDPLPERVCGRDMVVEKETFRTTSGEYCLKPNPNKAMERADCAINCRRVSFMTSVEKKIQGKTVQQPVMLSEMKDNYRGLRTPKGAPQTEPSLNIPDPNYIFDVVASGRAEAPVIPETEHGYCRLLDPYVSTYRFYHKPFTPDDQYNIGAKDHITFYSEANVPKVRGFGPRHKEVWMPLQSKVFRKVYDRSFVKKETKEVAAAHNPLKSIKSTYISESQRNYKVPFCQSPLAVWSPDVKFNLPPFPPNPYQTNIAPFMYCSDYCHYSMANSPNTVIDQINKVKPHKPCRTRFIVSENITL